MTLVNSHDSPGAALLRPAVCQSPPRRRGLTAKAERRQQDEESHAGGGGGRSAVKWHKGRGVLWGAWLRDPRPPPKASVHAAHWLKAAPPRKGGLPTPPPLPARLPPLSPGPRLLSRCPSWYKEQGRIWPWPPYSGLSCRGAWSRGGYPETRVRREVLESRGRWSPGSCSFFNVWAKGCQREEDTPAQAREPGLSGRAPGGGHWQAGQAPYLLCTEVCPQ